MHGLEVVARLHVRVVAAVEEEGVLRPVRLRLHDVVEHAVEARPRAADHFVVAVDELAAPLGDLAGAP